MINFRFHVVSLIAIFLALALGVVIGAGVIDRGVVDALNNRLDTRRGERRTGSRARTTSSQGQISEKDDAIDAICEAAFAVGRLAAERRRRRRRGARRRRATASALTAARCRPRRQRDRHALARGASGSSTTSDDDRRPRRRRSARARDEPGDAAHPGVASSSRRASRRRRRSRRRRPDDLLAVARRRRVRRASRRSPTARDHRRSSPGVARVDRARRRAPTATCRADRRRDAGGDRAHRPRTPARRRRRVRRGRPTDPATRRTRSADSANSALSTTVSTVDDLDRPQGPTDRRRSRSPSCSASRRSSGTTATVPTPCCCPTRLPRDPPRVKARRSRWRARAGSPCCSSWSCSPRVGLRRGGRDRRGRRPATVRRVLVDLAARRSSGPTSVGADLPNLDRLFAQSAVGGLVTNGVVRPTTLGASYVTLGAGRPCGGRRRRPRAGLRRRRALRRDPAGVVFTHPHRHPARRRPGVHARSPTSPRRTTSELYGAEVGLLGDELADAGVRAGGDRQRRRQRPEHARAPGPAVPAGGGRRADDQRRARCPAARSTATCCTTDAVRAVRAAPRRRRGDRRASTTRSPVASVVLVEGSDLVRADLASGFASAGAGRPDDAPRPARHRPARRPAARRRRPAARRGDRRRAGRRPTASTG